MAVVLETFFPTLSLLRRGKVRDVYTVDRDTLLIVATDRISAFDVVLPNAIPEKGRVLTALSLFFWAAPSSASRRPAPSAGPKPRRPPPRARFSWPSA